MSPNSEDAILKSLNSLTGEVSNIKGEFVGLKGFIEKQTTDCRSNYDHLTKSFAKISKQFSDIALEGEVTAKLKETFQRRLTDKRKFVYNTITLLCVVAATICTVTGLSYYWQSTYQQNNNSRIHAQANTASDQIVILAELRKLLEGMERVDEKINKKTSTSKGTGRSVGKVTEKGDEWQVEK